MTRAELILTGLVYTVGLLIAQRVIAIFAPETQEAGFGIAALIGAGTAAFLFHQREARTATPRDLLLVGALLAALTLVVGMFTQALWQPLAAPMIWLPVAAGVSFLLPLVMFPFMRAVVKPGTPPPAPIGTSHLSIAFVILIASMAIALLAPAGTSLNVEFTQNTLPGLEISLPDWPRGETSELFDFGSVKLTDPRRPGRYLAVNWSDSDPVQPDDYVKVITDLPARTRDATFVGGHEGVSYFLTAPDNAHARVTIWNCPNDHRVLWVFSFLAGSPESVRSVHERILQSVHCHTGGGRVGSAKAIFPNFAPPVGFSREPQPQAMVFTGPDAQTILFSPAAAGRSALLHADLAPEKVAEVLKGLDLMLTVEETPTQQTVRDVIGHERRVWSAVGTSRTGGAVQVDVMVWHCDVRNMTFLGAYATRERHNVQHGIDVLLPAVCHTANE